MNVTKSGIIENVEDCLNLNISTIDKNFINPIINSQSNKVPSFEYSDEINCLRDDVPYGCSNHLYIKKNVDFSNLQTQYDLGENKKNKFSELALINIKNEKKSVTVISPHETNKYEDLCKDEDIVSKYNCRGKCTNIFKRKYNKMVDDSSTSELAISDKNQSNINGCFNGNTYGFTDNGNEGNKKNDDPTNFDKTPKLRKKNKGSNNFCDKKNNYNGELNLKDSIHSDTLHIFKNAINLLLNDLKYKCIPNFDKKILNIIEIIDNHTNYVNSTFNETFLITYVHLFDTCVSNNILPSQMDPKIQKIFCNALIAFHILLFNFQRSKKY